MKKLISLTVLIAISFGSMYAQNSIREVGKFSIEAGLGLGVVASGYSMMIPPVKVDADYTVLTFGAGSLSVGGYFSLAVNRLTSYDTSVTTFLVGPMANVSYAISDNFNIFGKLIIGYVGVSTSDVLVNSFVKGSHVGAGIYAGGTWYFSPKMGVGAEVGYGGPTTFGVHLTFKI